MSSQELSRFSNCNVGFITPNFQIQSQLFMTTL